jgi:hypothetical protein
MKQRVLAKRETHVPDDALVALAAIERTHPEWLESPSFRADAVKFLTDPAAGVPESVREFVDDWPGAAALPSHVDAYRKLAQLQDLGS